MIKSDAARAFFVDVSTLKHERSWVAKFCYSIASNTAGQIGVTLLIFILTIVSLVGAARLKPDSSLTKTMVSIRGPYYLIGYAFVWNEIRREILCADIVYQ